MGPESQRHENEPEERTEAEPSPEVAAPVSALAAPQAEVLRLQRSAGNAAVSAMLARLPLRQAPPRPAADVAALDAMTLRQLHNHATEHPDWAQGITQPDHDQLVRVLEFGREENGGEQYLIRGCGHMRVGDLRPVLGNADVRAGLRSYAAHTGAASPSVRIEVPNHSVADADKMGRALTQLDTALGPATVRAALVNRTGREQIKEMAVDHDWTAGFIQYVQTAHPDMSGHDGIEARSYLLLRAETDPMGFVGLYRRSRVRNYHRFEAAALRALLVGEFLPPGMFPLSLVIHSAVDHNGAFHRSASVTAVLNRADRLPVLYEGAERLDDITNEIPRIAALGRGGRISEAVIAGHGAMNSMEMASGPGGQQSIDTRDAASQRLLNTLVDNIEDDADARIVLAACLTNAPALQTPLPPGAPGPAQQAAIQQDLANNPPLAQYVRDRLAAKGSRAQALGSNSSIPMPTMVNAGDPSGPLTLTVPSDPAAGADRLAYIRNAHEAEGGLRAILGAWSQHGAAVWPAVRHRIDHPAGNWMRTYMTRSLFSMVYDNFQNDLETIRVLATWARALDFLPFRGPSCNPGLLGGLNALAPAHRDRVADELARTDEWANADMWFMRLVVLEARLNWGNAHDVAFLRELGAAPSPADAASFLDWGILTPKLPRLVPAAAPPGLGPGDGTLRLALMAAAGNRGVAEGDTVRTYLTSLLDANNQFPAALNVDGLLSGISDAGTIAERVRPTAAAGGGGGGGGGGGAYQPPANIDIDGRAGADVFVRSTTRHAITAPFALNVRRGPGMRYPPFGWAQRGERLYVIGESGRWTAVEYGDRTGFVFTPLITGQALEESLDEAGP